jgi:hypothetical protein
MATPPTSSSMKSRFANFPEMIQWVETLKDPHLLFFVKRDLRVHGFKPGYMECSLVDAEHQHLLRQLKQHLQTQLNESWTFEVVQATVSVGATPTTFHEQRLNEEAEAKRQALETDLIQHALRTFEGAHVSVEATHQKALESLS